MTIYAGETVTWKTSATNIDDAMTPLIDTDVTGVEITIINKATEVEVLAATSMNWDAIDQEWRYTWTTPIVSENVTYKARLRIMGASFDTWEFADLKVKQNPGGF